MSARPSFMRAALKMLKMGFRGPLILRQKSADKFAAGLPRPSTSRHSVTRENGLWRLRQWERPRKCNLWRQVRENGPQLVAQIRASLAAIGEGLERAEKRVTRWLRASDSKFDTIMMRR